MPETEVQPVPIAKKSGKRRWVVLSAIAGAVIAILGGAAWRLSGGGQKPETAERVRIQSVLHLETFVMNLADPDGKAYLRVGIDLGLGQEQRKDGEAGVPTARVRDTILAVLAQCKPDELLTPEGKTKLKTELLQALRDRVPELAVEEIYSSSQVDQRKVGQLALAIQVAFQELGVFPSSNTQIPITTNEPMPFNTVQAIENAERTAALGRLVPPPKGALSGNDENGDLGGLRKELEEALSLEISRKEVALRTEPDGLVISLREIGFFESGSAAIRSDSQPAFSRMAHLLAERQYRIRIEGHTDNVPIHNSQFSDNWELSTARATELVRVLIVKYGFVPQRLSAAGFAEFHPIASNRSADGRALNRRVDVVILGKQSQATATGTVEPAP